MHKTYSESYHAKCRVWITIISHLFISVVSQLCFLLVFCPHKLYSQHGTQTDPCKMLISDNSAALTSNSHFNHSAPASWPPCYYLLPQEHFCLRDSTLPKKLPSTFRFLPKYYLPNVTYPDSTIFLLSASFSRVILI